MENKNGHDLPVQADQSRPPAPHDSVIDGEKLKEEIDARKKEMKNTSYINT